MKREYIFALLKMFLVFAFSSFLGTLAISEADHNPMQMEWITEWDSEWYFFWGSTLICTIGGYIMFLYLEGKFDRKT